MELEAWIKPVNSRLSFFCSTILLAYQLLSCSRRSDSGKCHSPLSGSSTLVLFLPLAQITAETGLSIHDSPFFAHEQDTVRIFAAPPYPTGKVSCPPALSPPPAPPHSSLPC